MEKEELLRASAEEYLLEESHRRRFLYKDVEELIQNGFLHHTVLFEDESSVTFRTLLPEDLVRFQARAISHSRRSEPLNVLRWSLSSSVWMVNGFEVSSAPGENGSYHIYQDWIKDLPKSWVESLYGTILGLRNRLDRTLRLVESYCYEPYSRASWKMIGRSPRGLENANITKRLWVAHNLTEDLSQQEDREWSHTQALVSSMTNAGGKQIQKILKQGQERETTRRQRVIEETVNWVIQGDNQKPLTLMVNGREVVVPRIHSAQSVEDLEEEMRKVFTGEKDYHDLLVDQYHEGIRKRVMKQREERQEAILRARQLSEEAEERGDATLVGYTREQLDELNPEVLKPRTTANVPDSAQASYLFDRYFNPKLAPGVVTPNLKVVEPEKKSPEQVEKQAGPPQSLQEKIENRSLKLKE